MTTVWTTVVYVAIGLFLVERGLSTSPEYRKRPDLPLFVLAIIATWPVLLAVVLYRRISSKK